MSDHPISILGGAGGPSHDRASLEALRRLAPASGSEAGWPPLQRLDELLVRVRHRVAQVMARCAAVDVFVAAQLDFSSTTDDVEAVYADLQLFCRWHRTAGDEAAGSSEEARQRVEVCERLIESEARLAHQVNQWLLFLQSQQGADSALRLFLSQVAVWHAHMCRQLEAVCRAELRRLDAGSPRQRHAGREPLDEDRGDAELAVLADELIDAGELELLTAFTGLAHAGRRHLIALLSDPERYARRGQLIERLWQVADLVLAEDPKGEGPSSLLGVLRRDGEYGRRFQSLEALLGAELPDPSDEALDARFGAGQPLGGEIRSMLRRALIVGHEGQRGRHAAAAALPLDDLWQVLVYPHSPLAAMRVIAEQVAERGDDDLCKVLFDCVKSRLMTALGEVADADGLEPLGAFIGLFFSFGFFIQTRYFEQLETLLHLFQAQAGRFGAPAVRLGRELHRLEIARHRAGSPEATEPRTLDRLPLPVQRHLAREGCYLTYFACHPNHLIAREVVHFVHADNLSRFLKLPDLNRQMLEDAMRRVDLGGKRDLIVEVLTHPKCPMLFAGKQLPHLGRHELHRVVRGRSTHSEVKRKAMLIMIRHKRPGTGAGAARG